MYRDAIQFHGLFSQSVSQSESSEVLSFYSAPPPLVQAAAAASTVRCCPNPHREERTERLGPPVTGTPTPPLPTLHGLGFAWRTRTRTRNCKSLSPLPSTTAQLNKAEQRRAEPSQNQSKANPGRPADGTQGEKEASGSSEKPTPPSNPPQIPLHSVPFFPSHTPPPPPRLFPGPHIRPPPLSLSSPAAIALPHCAGSYQSSAGPCRRRA